MKTKMKASVCAMALLLGLSLSGCGLLINGIVGGGSKQEEAGDAVEAVTHFLTDLQSGDYEAAETYLKEGNELLHVLAAAEGESVPELDEVYRQFCSQMSELTFRVAEDGESSSDSIVMVTAQNRNYSSAIYAAMLEALQNQCAQGGSAFADFAGWMGQGVIGAAAGEEDSARAITALINGSYILGHEGYPDQTFLNLITGGFYDFADLTMTTCVSEMDDVRYTYYIVALGDRMVASLTEIAEPLEGSGLTEADVAQLQEYYQSIADGQKGIYAGLYAQDGWVVAATGIDFETADQTALINSGIVSGKFKGNTTTSYLSLASTISSFESDGLTCVTVPQYDG